MAGERVDPGSLVTVRPVAIVGGSHAGLLLALALDRVGLPVTVVESAAVERTLAAPRDGRALALMYGSKRVFDSLGLWSAFTDLATPVLGARVEDTSSGATVDYDASTVGDHPFAYGIETADLRRRLLELVLERPTIELIAPAALAGLERRGGSVRLRLDDGRTVAAALVVGADGRASTVRDRAGIGVFGRAYGQTALTFALAHERSHERRVREYLRPAGPLALLPLGPRRSAVTWVEGRAIAEHLLARGPGAIATALAEQIGDLLGAFAIDGVPRGHPLGLLQARRLVAPRVALVGDAAHGIHPIHAQGFNLGVRGVAALAEVLVDASRAGLDPGSGEVLLRYARARAADIGLVVGLTDGLARLFSTDLGPARLLRRLGLEALDQVPLLKQLAIRRGMGLAGDLPRLARGQQL